MNIMCLFELPINFNLNCENIKIGKIVVINEFSWSCKESDDGSHMPADLQWHFACLMFPACWTTVNSSVFVEAFFFIQKHVLQPWKLCFSVHSPTALSIHCEHCPSNCKDGESVVAAFYILSDWSFFFFFFLSVYESKNIQVK